MWFTSSKPSMNTPNDPYRHIIKIFSLTVIALTISGCWRNSEARFQRLKRKGQEHYIQREYAEALRIWDKALSIRPNDANIYRKIGKTHIRLAAIDKAAESFQKALKISPDSKGIWLELGRLQLASHNAHAAEESWEHLRLAAHDPQVQLFYGDLLVVKGQLNEAIDAYRHVIKLKPNLDVAKIKLASCYLAQGKKKEAEATFNIVASKNITSSNLLFQMANYFKIAEELKTAEKYMIRAIHEEPEDLGLKNALAELYFDIGDYKKARRTLEFMLKEMPKNKFIKKFLADVLLHESNLDEAHAILNELAQEYGNDLELHLLLGKYYFLKQDAINGISHFKLAIEKEPTFPLGHYLLALSYLLGGQISLAQGSLIQALSLAPNFRDAELTLAVTYYKKSDFDLGLQHVERILRSEPENFRAHLILGNILLAQKRYDEAIAAFNTSQLLFPESSSPLYYLAFTSHLANEIGKALQLYLAVLNQNPELMDATMTYAMMLVKTGEANRVETFLKDAIAKFPQNAFLHHILGEVNLITGRKEEAKANFIQAISLNSELVVSYIRLIELYKMDSDFKELIGLLSSCINNFPDFSKAYIEMAELYRQKGNFNKAIKILNEAIRRAPDSPKLANSLAWLYLEKGNGVNKAYKLAQFAYQRLPEDPAIADTLGWIYFKKKLYTQAVWLLKDALSRNPDHPLIHFHLGMTFNAMGNEKSALENLGRALALNLETTYRKEAEQLYQQLQN